MERIKKIGAKVLKEELFGADGKIRPSLIPGDAEKAVLFIPQTLSDAQKEQARTNIGAQGKNDQLLQTETKNIVGAINEVNSIARGAGHAIVYSGIAAMVAAVNAMDMDEMPIGTNIYLVALNVPDLWVSGIEDTSEPYTYTSDEDFTDELEENGSVRAGFFRLSALETQKVDLSDYYTKTEIDAMIGDVESALDEI